MIIEDLAKRVRVQRGLRGFHNKKKQTKANSGIWVPSGNKNGLICSQRDAQARGRERFHGFLFPKEVLPGETLAHEIIPPRRLGYLLQNVIRPPPFFFPASKSDLAGFGVAPEFGYL